MMQEEPVAQSKGFAGIDGEISFTESLQRRIALLQAKREHLDELVARLKQKVSKSIQENKQFFEECFDN